MYLHYIFEQDHLDRGMMYISEERRDLDSVIKDITKTHGEKFQSLELEMVSDFFRISLEDYEKYNGNLHESFPGLVKKIGQGSILYINPNDPNMERVYELFKMNISITGPIDISKMDGMWQNGSKAY